MTSISDEPAAWGAFRNGVLLPQSVTTDRAELEFEAAGDWIGCELRPLYTAPSHEGVRATHRHKKRGSEYVLIGIGKMQAEDWYRTSYTTDDGHEVDEPQQSVDMREVAIYRSVDDGSLWVRPLEEFEDGRFIALSTNKEDEDATA
jgi:hypothetical protein